MMNALILSAVLVLAQAPTPAPGQGRDAPRDNTPISINGSWTVICYEKDGKPMPEAKNVTVTVKDNMITFTGAKDNMMAPLKVDFGQQGTIRVTETQATDSTKPTPSEKRGQPMTGVYVLTSEYLAICLHDNAPAQPGDVTPAGGTTAGQQNQNQNQNPSQMKSKCTVILKRGDRTGSEPNK